MKVRDIIRMVEQGGWFQVAQAGSHRQYKHPTKSGRVTVPGHLNGLFHVRLRVLRSFVVQLFSADFTTKSTKITKDSQRLGRHPKTLKSILRQAQLENQ
jgi:predicted RNA binding protein YcfA (HicA-like mRNA interferase family)